MYGLLKIKLNISADETVHLFFNMVQNLLVVLPFARRRNYYLLTAIHAIMSYTWYATLFEGQG